MKTLDMSSNDQIVFEDSSDSDEYESEEIDGLFSNCELLKEIVVSENEYVLGLSATRFVTIIFFIS